MATHESARSHEMSLVWSAVFRAVRLLVLGLVGWLGFVSEAGSVWRGVSLAAVLGLAALVGVMWYLFRVRAERRHTALVRDRVGRHSGATRGDVRDGPRRRRAESDSRSVE
jgi:hypothetical protein